MAESFSVPCATQNTAWYHQHLGTTTETGDECGQNGGSQKQNAFHPPMPWSRTKCSGGAITMHCDQTTPLILIQTSWNHFRHIHRCSTSRFRHDMMNGQNLTQMIASGISCSSQHKVWPEGINISSQTCCNLARGSKLQ